MSNDIERLAYAKAWDMTDRMVQAVDAGVDEFLRALKSGKTPEEALVVCKESRQAMFDLLLENQDRKVCQRVAELVVHLAKAEDAALQAVSKKHKVHKVRLAMRRMLKLPSLIVLSVLVIVAFLYMWPGLWRYDYYSNGLIRRDRLNGELQRWVTEDQVTVGEDDTISRYDERLRTETGWHRIK